MKFLCDSPQIAEEIRESRVADEEVEGYDVEKDMKTRYNDIINNKVDDKFFAKYFSRACNNLSFLQYSVDKGSMIPEKKKSRNTRSKFI